MSVIKALLRNELRSLRTPFVVLTLAHLFVIPSFVEWRSGSFYSPELLILPIVFTSFIVVDRVFLAHRRGTWLLLPMSRVHQVAAKLGLYSLLLFAHTLMGALLFYGFIRASGAPGQPLPSLPEFVWGEMAWQLAIALDILTLGWVASVQEKKWMSAFWVASAAVLGVGLNQIDHVSSFASVQFSLDVKTRYTLAAVVVAVIGGAMVRLETERFGRAKSLPLLGFRALGLTPFAMFILLGLLVPFDHIDGMRESPRLTYEYARMLVDGEIAIFAVEENVGETGVRKNGEKIFVPWAARTSDPRFPDWPVVIPPVDPETTRTFVGRDSWYLSPNHRQALLYDRQLGKPTFGRQIGCWGEDGFSQGTDCAPFSEEIVGFSDIYMPTRAGEREPLGQRLITSTRVIDRDLRGVLHERFRGEGILSAAVLNQDQSVVFTRTQTHLVGDVSRACPPIPPTATTLLSDGTLAFVSTEILPPRSFLDRLHTEYVSLRPQSRTSVVFCSPDGVLREEMWPEVDHPFADVHRHRRGRISVMFPFQSTTWGSDATPWMMVPIALLRLFGVIALGIVWRKRGFLISLPGIVFGPAYFLAAAFVLREGKEVPSANAP